MKNLKFKRLVLVSDTTKSAAQFMFHERFNLITGKNNSIGKSSLVKNIFWALGCEPNFDDTWKSLGCKVLLEFEIDRKNYKVLRSNAGSIILGTPEKSFQRFTKITGEYSELFLQLVAFKAKLPNKKNKLILETPPPAYYFLPFYIDQIKGWSDTWNSFNSLAQYSDWKRTIAKYHTGYLPPKYFEIEEKIYEYKVEKSEINEVISQIDTAINIVEKYTPQSNLAITEQELDIITEEVQNKLGNLAKEQEDLFNQMNDIKSSKYHLNNQLEFAKRAAIESEKDYRFTVENIGTDELECPLCGVMHDNSLVNRASLLFDKQQAEEQVSLIYDEIRKLEALSSELQPKLELVRTQIYEINQKYDRTDKEQTPLSLPEIIDRLASKSVKNNVKKTKQEKQALYKDRDDKEKVLKKEQKKLLSKGRKQELDNFFLGLVEEFLNDLGVQGVSLSKIKNPMDYNKITGGGAAESTRAILAYYLTIFKQIYYACNEIPAPLVIDTPNQQEQANQNYAQIIKLLIKNTPSESQIIICGMENLYLDEYKRKAHIISLDNGKLLKKGEYKELTEELSHIFEMAKHNK